MPNNVSLKCGLCCTVEDFQWIPSYISNCSSQKAIVWFQKTWSIAHKMGYMYNLYLSFLYGHWSLYTFVIQYEKKSSVNIFLNLLLCSVQESKSYRFEMTRVQVNNYTIFISVWMWVRNEWSDFRDLFTYWFVDPKNVSTVCQCFIWPKVGHGLGLDPRALLPLQHAWARCAIERVDLKDKSTSTTNANLNYTSSKAQILFVAMRFIIYRMLIRLYMCSKQLYYKNNIFENENQFRFGKI